VPINILQLFGMLSRAEHFSAPKSRQRRLFGGPRTEDRGPIVLPSSRHNVIFWRLSRFLEAQIPIPIPNPNHIPTFRPSSLPLLRLRVNKFQLSHNLNIDMGLGLLCEMQLRFLMVQRNLLWKIWWNTEEVGKIK